MTTGVIVHILAATKIAGIAAVMLTSVMVSTLFLTKTTTAAAASSQNTPLSISSSHQVDSNADNGNTGKVVIPGFSDNTKSQFANAKPILDRYGFKATFFVICNKVGQSEDKMTWEDIATLQNEGHDIQSHSMNHEWMDRLSASELDFEIGESKSVWQTMA